MARLMKRRRQPTRGPSRWLEKGLSTPDHQKGALTTPWIFNTITVTEHRNLSNQSPLPQGSTPMTTSTYKGTDIDITAVSKATALYKPSWRIQLATAQSIHQTQCYAASPEPRSST